MYNQYVCSVYDCLFLWPFKFGVIWGGDGIRWPDHSVPFHPVTLPPVGSQSLAHDISVLRDGMI